MKHKTIYENPFVQVRLDDRGIVSLKNKKGGAVILPVTKEKDVLLMKVFRPAINDYSLEIPRGFKEENEEPSMTAKRELYEEISAVSKTIIPLGYLYPDTGLIDSKVELFLGLDSEIKENKVQTEEGIQHVVKVPYQDAYQMAIGGGINDAFTLAAILRSREYF
ncbi:hypothetical protein AJ85_00145 [Alkalihalobacillus alcalophilus ATCC 27647 = CGMCC 1.3604]|uniref:NUDIX hydrolase n=1 Tax=Alkalihalobacillus alcalophilus ATCC 27647 = CGMCC 1.3604 TaxID=1218173 RepID=A0A094WI27_ALKAL|nr:NUDIX hydrolase [Alkalihalobacillus alcalophilus]KGA95558.1 NUDIX hydrolase [Alkalihalobacillus alcalophilus ATCC 27647 = CGMCC 1.3604]MED1564341.1 NUDIX hydrolase [Alkalihalobacillus alcalophilus]THG88757.1 hypothetical protein AJ85_00145 [Alkalihalobacillus alcalophilus ATCC 27647 = CGMCC 1.3604]